MALVSASCATQDAPPAPPTPLSQGTRPTPRALATLPPSFSTATPVHDTPTSLAPAPPAHAARLAAALDPTLAALCRQPGQSDSNVCAAHTTAPPPTPAVPFSQALRQFTGRAVLYRRYPGFLMLGDPDSGASLWLNGVACPHEHTLTVDGQWSADGRFIAFDCQNDTDTAAIYLLDM